MKLKYYLRGLGIGILVTTVILSIAGAGKKGMSEEEIRQRAKELGMVESTLLTDLADQQKNDTPAKEDEAKLPQETGQAPEETDGEESIPEETTVQENATLVIGRGESSTTVSKNLQKAGVINDAVSFDKFLCSNGYDKKIITGTYEIPFGASEDEIAKIITRK